MKIEKISRWGKRASSSSRRRYMNSPAAKNNESSMDGQIRAPTGNTRIQRRENKSLDKKPVTCLEKQLQRSKATSTFYSYLLHISKSQGYKEGSVRGAINVFNYLPSSFINE